MVYVSPADFYEKARTLSPLSREEERACALKMREGDPAARERLIEGYLPMIASRLARAPAHMQTLSLVLSCVGALERAVDSFDFLQEHDPFSHRVNWCLRQVFARYAAK